MSVKQQSIDDSNKFPFNINKSNKNKINKNKQKNIFKNFYKKPIYKS